MRLVANQEVVAMTVGVGVTGFMLRVPFAACLFSLAALLLGMWMIRYITYGARQASAPANEEESESLKEMARKLRNRPGPWDVDHSTMRTPPNKGNRFKHVWYRKK